MQPIHKQIFIMSHLLIFGMGYTGTRLAKAMRARGWQVHGVTRSGRDGTLIWGTPEVLQVAASATHILSSVPPLQDGDAVLRDYADALRAPWLGYLSTTGVYGDTQGAWVDENAPLGSSTRSHPRARAEALWRDIPNIHIFRLPGIYGPFGRSALDRVREGRAHRIDMPQHVFCRIHVDDIVATLIAALSKPKPGIYNVSDDLPTSGNDVIEYACELLGLPFPALKTLDDAGLTPLSRSFYTDGFRRVRNDKIKRDLGVVLRYPSYREGLQACLADEADLPG
jgi:nucleoside-diphosphate-sugar epimerase